MPMQEAAMREHILTTLMRRVRTDDESRREALRDYFGVAMPVVEDGNTDTLAAMVPPVMPELYEKWITLFIDRLFETVPREQIKDLCGEGAKSEATLTLVYAMFLESERMEKQVAEDLAEYGLARSADDDMGSVAASYLQGKIAALKRGVSKPGN